jgi:membrane dipeptidase
MKDHTTTINRRQLLKRLGTASAAVVVAPMINRRRFRLFANVATEYSTRAIDLMKRATVIDMLSPFLIGSRGNKWFSNPDSFTAADLQRYKDSGINVFHIAVGTGGRDAYLGTLRFVSLWDGFIANHDQTLMRVDSVADLERVKSSGKVGVLIGVQNSEHFQSVEDVSFFHGLGQRVSQLTYNTRNLIGNGSTERRDDGLSDFGVSIVERMNKVGMAVDVSHCGDRTTLDAFEVSKKPVLITHSNCRALVAGHPRLKTDEAIKKMAASGGVMGITGVRMFVKAEEPTTIEHVLDHFDHVAKLVGVEFLGIGSDMDLDGYDDLPADENKRLRASYKDSYGFREKIDIEGLDHPKRVFDLTEGLIRRKYTDQQIELILGGNFKRVLAQIWTVS